MVYTEQHERGVTRIVGGGGGTAFDPDINSDFWVGSCVSEAPSTNNGWTSHVNVPITSPVSNDPRGIVTPVAGGLEFNFPGTYLVEMMGYFTGGSANARFGLLFYTQGNEITPGLAPGNTPMGGQINYTAQVGNALYYHSTLVVHVLPGEWAVPNAVKIQDYVQSSTAHTATVTRLSVTKIVQGSPGPEGAVGPEGPQGVPGTRWGYTHIWAFADSTDIACTMYDGDPPRVNDLLISLNGFSVGEVYKISAVNPGGGVDVEPYNPALNLKGPRGTNWGTTTDVIVGAAGTLKANVTVTMPDGEPVKGGDWIISSTNGDVYIVYQALDATHADLKKMTPELNIRGPEGPAGGLLDAYPVDSVYISFANTNPTAYFGGTWVSIGTGRMLIGVDPADAAMDAAGDVGGSKTNTLGVNNLPPHQHGMDHQHARTGEDGAHTHTGTWRENAGSFGPQGNIAAAGGTAGTVVTKQVVNNNGTLHDHNIPFYNGNTQDGSALGLDNDPINNLPPFLAVYMWRRTA